MESKEMWERGNETAGNLCALFAGVGILIPVGLYLAEAETGMTLLVFFLYTITAIGAVLALPIWLLEKKLRS